MRPSLAVVDRRILRGCPYPAADLKCVFHDGMFILAVDGTDNLQEKCELTAKALANVGRRLTGADPDMVDVRCVFGSLYFQDVKKCNSSVGVFNELISTHLSGAFPGCQTTTTTPDICDLMGDDNKLVDVTLISNSGSVFTLKGNFTRLREGNVGVATPNHGMDGTHVRIRGSNLLGGGTKLTSVKLAGLEVRSIISANDTLIYVRAAESKQNPLVGDVDITASLAFPPVMLRHGGSAIA